MCLQRFDVTPLYSVVWWACTLCRAFGLSQSSDGLGLLFSLCWALLCPRFAKLFVVLASFNWSHANDLSVYELLCCPMRYITACVGA